MLEDHHGSRLASSLLTRLCAALNAEPAAEVLSFSLDSVDDQGFRV